MQHKANTIYGYAERVTTTGDLTTTWVVVEGKFVLEDGDGCRRLVEAGDRLMVVERVDPEQPLVEELVDLAELGMHARWSRNHYGQETRTPFDLRTSEAGGREDEQVPF